MKQWNLLPCLFVLIIASSALADVPVIIDVNHYPDPVVSGNSITFDVNWYDPDGDSVELHICKTDDADASTQSCGGGSWCDSDYEDDNFTSCSYTAQDADVGNNDYYAFICDDAECSDEDSGSFDVPGCSITTATTPIAKDGSTTVSISYSGYSGDPTSYSSIDCGDANAIGGIIACSGGSCDLNCGPYATGGDYTIKDLNGLTYNGEVANCTGSASINVDCTCPSISVKSIAGDDSSPYWDTIEDNVTTLILSGESGMSCKYDSADKNFYSQLSNDCSTSGSEATCNLGDLDQNSYTYYYACVDSLDNNSAVSSVSFGVDWNAPAKVTGLSASAQSSSSIRITWTANSEDDLDYYKIYRDNSEITTVDEGTEEYTNSGLNSSTSYTYKVSAVDDAGNEGEKSDSDSETTESGDAPSKPDIESDTHSDDSWSTNDDIEFEWNTVSGVDYYCKWDDDDDTEPTTSCGGGRKEYDNVDDGIWYFHLRARNDQYSDTDHFTVKIDTSNPSKVTDLTVVALSDGTIDIVWDSASDSTSGVKEYWLYRWRTSGFDASDARRIYTGTSRSYNDNGATEGTKYYYKVRAVDNAGNQGELSSEKSVTAKGLSCEFSVEYNFDEYIGGGEFYLEMTADDDMHSIDFTGRIYGVGTLRPETINKERRLITATYDIEGSLDGEEGEFNLSATDDEGNDCWYKKEFTIDAIAPDLNLLSPADGDDLNGIVELRAEATDSRSSMKVVNFYYKKGDEWTRISGDATPQNDEYSVNWNTNEVSDGSYQLKAEAKDDAGNITAQTINVTISNGIGPPEEVIYETAEYEFDEGELEKLLQNAGLEEGLIDEAIELMEGNAIEMELVITKVGDNYWVKIVIKFTNNLDENISIQIIELIPKSFAENANDIESSLDFEVIEEDPIIKFVIEDVNPNERIELIYLLADSLTKGEADELIDGDVLEDFVAPPIVLEEGSDISESFKEVGGFPPITAFLGLFSIGNILTLFGGLVVILVIVVIILAIIAGAAFVSRGGKEGSRGPTPEEPEIEGLHTVIKTTEPGVVGKISDRVKELFSPKEKGKEGKFVYKGK